MYHNTRANSATATNTITMATITSIDVPCSITMFVDAVCRLVTEERVVIGIRLKLLLNTDTTTPYDRTYPKLVVTMSTFGIEPVFSKTLWLPQSIHSIAVRGLADAPDIVLGSATIDDCITRSIEAIEEGRGTPIASETYEETGMLTEPIGVAGIGTVTL